MNRKLFPVIAVIAVLLTASCALAPFFADAFSPSNSSVLKIDASGAKAVAGIEAQSRSGSKGIDSKALEEDPILVKFLEDGTIASVIETDGNMGWTPNIAFITTGDDGSIYVGFDSMWWIWTGNESSGVQFIRIYPNSDYDVLWPPSTFEAGEEDETGQISVWGWWGMEQDPLVKGADGKLYFKVETWGFNSTSHKIYRYDPEEAVDPVEITPEKASLFIDTFMIDNDNHLFIQSGGNYDADSSAYMRYYTEGETGYKTIYYSSDQDTWVRGYTTSPNDSFLILNGSNIRGMNGIIKVTDLDADSPSYEIMYSNANGGGNWIQLINYSNDSWENNTELIDRDSDLYGESAYAWRSDVKDGFGDVDKSKILLKIGPYFYETPTFKDAAAEAYFTGPLSGVDAGSSNSNPLWQRMESDPVELLKEYFNGQLFSEWLDDNNMTDLYFDNIGSMLWASDGALYGLYDSGWWSGGDAAGTKVIRLLNSSGDRDLDVISLANGDRKPSMIKIEGDYLYYRYAVLDGMDAETGLHQLSRIKITTGVESEILPLDLMNKIEIVSYDTSSDNSEVYFVGADPQTNEMINGKINVADRTWQKIDTTLRFGNIKVIE